MAFADLASRRIDLSTVSMVTPQVTVNPVLDQSRGMLRMQGVLLLQPVPVAYEVLYQSVGGCWRLFGISAPQPQTATRMPSPPPARN